MFLLSAYGWELYGGRYDGVFFFGGGETRGGQNRDAFLKFSLTIERYQWMEEWQECGRLFTLLSMYEWRSQGRCIYACLVLRNNT